MWQEILNGFVGNLTPMTLLIIFAGTVFGAITGALPGISAITAMALVLPLTFGLEPAQGLVLLGAVYMSSEFGGAIPAILFGTPGGSGAACTMLDGYPMTKKGEAEEALYLQLFAGTIGGAVGVLLLLFFTPFLARAAQSLGPPELFWAAAAGLALVATLVGRDIVGGLISVTVGVMLTFPGSDLTTGILRFTFGSSDMVGGLPLVPVMLGLFAVASILLMLELPDDIVAPLNRRPGVIPYVLRRMWGMKGMLTWTSFVGAAVGLVPGAGASASAFAAYSEAKRLSKTPSEFGTGMWEGVAAPEAANNAVVGGGLVSLLGIGIPASPAAAIMFGALTVQGLVAGPALFRDHSAIAYTFMTGLLLSVFAMVIFGLATVRYSALVTRFPVRYVVPGVLALTLVGAFSQRNNPFDIIVAVVVGLAAFILAKVGISWIPMALGLVLGPVMEQRYQQSAIIATTRGGLFSYWMTRPVTVALMLVVLALVISGTRQVTKAGRTAQSMDADAAWADRVGIDVEALMKPANDVTIPVRGSSSATAAEGGMTGNLTVTGLTAGSEAPSEDAARAETARSTATGSDPTEPPSPPRWITFVTSNILVGSGSIALGAWVIHMSRNWRAEAAQFPTVVSIGLIVLGVIMLMLTFIPRLRERARAGGYPFAGVPWRKWFILVVGLLVVAFWHQAFGLLEGLLVYSFLVVMVLTDPTKPRLRSMFYAAVYSVLLVVSIFVVFEKLLGVPLPAGPIF